MRRFLRLWLPPVLAAAAALCWRVDSAAHPGLPGVTWTTAAGRLLETHCAACHDADGTAPRLDTYESARLAAPAIRRAVLLRHMPRWHADPAFGEFRNDPRLTAHEAELLAQWADGRAPYGEPPAGTPAAPAPSMPPDLLLRIPAKSRIDGAVRTFKLPMGSREDRWIRGWTFLPGNRSLITAAVISLDSGTVLGTWVEGERETYLPRGITERLPAGAAVWLTIHYRRTSVAASDASGLGLYFADRPERQLRHLSLPCGTSRVAESSDLLAVRPRVGADGRALTILARRPDGSVVPLGRFQDYPASYPQTYWFSDPVRLPGGTAIAVEARPGEACGADAEYVRSGVPIAARAIDDPTPAGSAAAGSAGYWCPMHATERAPGPGRCTQCGMALVPITPEVEGKYSVETTVLARGGTLRLTVRDPRTRALVRQFETVHERPFHLFLVSDDLNRFVHVHPISRPDGSLELSPVPLRSGPYHLFADFMPSGGTPQLISHAVIPAGERLPDGGTRRLSQAASATAGALAVDVTAKTAGRLRVRLEIEHGLLVAGAPSLITFHLEDASTGEPVTDLEPYLGAWGHAFVVSADLADAVHSHPLTPLTRPGGPAIVFQQRFPRAGSYRLWAQFQRGGRVETVSFTVAAIEAEAR